MLKIKSKRQGAELTSILKDGNEMLFDGKTFWNRQSPILFPIVGQIKGGHPAFKCDYSTGDYEILFEQNEENIEFLKLRNGLIDTENATNILEENKIHLTENIFDNDAIIMKNIKSNKVILQNRNTNKKILEFDFTDFPYLALWSKKGAPFVCIEPWQNTADKIDSNQIFKEKENILSLEPDEIYSCKYIVKFY